MSKTYIDGGFITIHLEGTNYNVAFKNTGFKAPWIQESPLDIPSLVKKEAPLMKDLAKAYKSNKEDVIAELEAKCVLPKFIAGYVESGQKSNQLFDILEDKDFKIASIPDSDKPKLADENAALLAENEEMKAKLAQLEGVDPAEYNLKKEENDSLLSEIEELKAKLAQLEGTGSTEDAKNKTE